MSAINETKEGLGQIREIVVGPLEREVDRRLGRLEALFTARGIELPQEARRRMEVIEAHMRKETDALSATATTLEHRVTKLEELVVKQLHDVRQELLDQAKLFLDELQGLRTELTHAMERELGSLEPDGGEEAIRRERPEIGESASP